MFKLFKIVFRTLSIKIIRIKIKIIINRTKIKKIQKIRIVKHYSEIYISYMLFNKLL